MTQLKEQHCVNCLYFIQVPDGRKCRRNPPIRIMAMPAQGNPLLIGGQKAQPMTVQFDFPATNLTNWCGEWKENPVQVNLTGKPQIELLRDAVPSDDAVEAADESEEA